MAEQITAEQFRKSVEEHYALKKELNHKNKVINDLIDRMSEIAEKYKLQLFEKDNKIEELNDELRIARSEIVLLTGLMRTD
jgi:hypothetical protein